MQYTLREIKINTPRKNIGNKYFGLIRIKVRSSSTLHRRIVGWIKGVNLYYWKNIDF